MAGKKKTLQRFTAMEIAKILHIPYHRVIRWAQTGKLGSGAELLQLPGGVSVWQITREAVEAYAAIAPGRGGRPKVIEAAPPRKARKGTGEPSPGAGRKGGTRAAKSPALKAAKTENTPENGLKTGDKPEENPKKNVARKR